MTEAEIQQIVEQQIERARSGRQAENNKFDFKREWYDLSTKGRGYYEFLKDTSAIANTFGPDGLLVIGYDEQADTFVNSPVTASGLSDSLKVVGVIVRNVVEAFDINIYEIEYEGHLLTAIHIPPSLNKPHMIKEFKRWDRQGKVRSEEQRIFVRKDSGTQYASKHDLELMYYDRKNILLEYEVAVHCWGLEVERGQLILSFSIENTGRRPISISRFDIGLESDEEPTFSLRHKKRKHHRIPVQLGAEHMTINPGRMLAMSNILFTGISSTTRITREQIQNYLNDPLIAILTLTNGKAISTRLHREK